MNTPPFIQNAVIAIWITILISAFSSAISARLGYISEGALVGEILMLAICCIIPYKINNRSNAARYVYLVINVLSIFIILGGAPSTKADIISYVIETPLVIFALYNLFQPTSSNWFTSKEVSPPPLNESPEPSESPYLTSRYNNKNRNLPIFIALSVVIVILILIVALTPPKPYIDPTTKALIDYQNAQAAQLKQITDAFKNDISVQQQKITSNLSAQQQQLREQRRSDSYGARLSQTCNEWRATDAQMHSYTSSTEMAKQCGYYENYIQTGQLPPRNY